MKNVMYVVALAMLGSSVALAGPEVRASVAGTTSIKGVDVAIEEEVRENIDIETIDVLSLPAYSHTQLTLSREFLDIFSIKGTGITLGAGGRNANQGGTILNRLQVDGSATYKLKGVEAVASTSLQQTIDNSNIASVELGSLTLREKASIGYSYTIQNITLGVEVGDEIFLTEGGITENRASVGTSVTAYDKYAVSAEYFLQSQGDLLTPDLQLGEPENGNVIAVNASVSF